MNEGTTAEQSKKRGDLWKKLLLSAVTLVVMLAALELVARLYQRKVVAAYPGVPDDIAEHFKTFQEWLPWNLELGQVRDYTAPFETNYQPFTVIGLKPNYHFKIKNIETKTNSLGFRHDGELVTPKPKDTFRIFLLGGSTVQGIYNKDWTIEQWLTPMLSGVWPGKNVEVVNAGVGGYYSQNEIALLQTKIIDLEPDLVVIYDGYNDMQYGAQPGYEKRGGPSLTGEKTLLDSLVNYPSLGLLATYTAKYLAHESAFVKIMYRLITKSNAPTTYPTDASVDEKAIETYVGNVKLMKATLETQGIRGVIAFQPQLSYCKDKPSAYEQSIFSYMKEHNDTNWREVSQEVWPRVGKLIDNIPDSALVKTRDISCLFKDSSDTDYVDSIHATPEGYKKIAATLADIIKKDLAR